MYFLRPLLSLLVSLSAILTPARAQQTPGLIDQLGVHHSQVAQLVQGIINGDTTSVSDLQLKLAKAQSLLNSAQTATRAIALPNADAGVLKAVQGLQTTLIKQQTGAAQLLTLAQTELAKGKPDLPKVKQYTQQAQMILIKAKTVHAQLKSKLK